MSRGNPWRGFGDGTAKLVTIRTRHLVLACAVLCGLIYCLGWAALDRLEAVRSDCVAEPYPVDEDYGPDFEAEPLPTFEVL